MAIKRDAGERQRLGFEVDPAVDAAMAAADDPSVLAQRRRQKLRQMTPGQRRKAERDLKRCKVTYDLPPELAEQVEAMARETYQVPASHLAALLMMAGIEAVKEGRLDVVARRVISRVPRFEYFLDLTADGHGSAVPLRKGGRK